MVVPIVVAVLTVTLVTALVIVERHLHRRVPEEVAARLHQAFGVDAEVQLAGRPRDWLRARSVAAATVTAPRVPVHGGRAAIDLTVHVTDVRVVRAPGGRRLTAADGRFDARLGPDDVRRLAALPVGFRRLELRNGHLRLFVAAGFAVDLDVALEDGAIVLRPRTPLPGLRWLLDPKHTIRLDRLPAGAAVTRVRVGRDGVHASGPFDPDGLGEGADRTGQAAKRLQPPR